MDDFEKNLLESLQNFDMKILFMKGSYVEIQTHDSFMQGFILEKKGNEKYELIIQNNNGIAEVPINMLNFYCENDYPKEVKIRDIIINQELKREDADDLASNINQQLKEFNIKLNSKNYNQIFSTKNKIPDKNGKMIDVTGYLAYQFFCGHILDCLAIINRELLKKNLDDSHKNLFIYILDIILFMGEIVKTNLKKYKIAFYNRKLLIVNPIYAILIAFDSLIINLIQKYQYNYSSIKDLDYRLSEIVNQVYEIILYSKSKSYIPLPCLIIFIRFIIFGEVKDRIKNNNYDKTKVYQILNEHLKNLNENELKFYKKNSDMRKLCDFLVHHLFNDSMDVLVEETFYYYLLSCLKCKNLEKKMNALNDINDIINEFKSNVINQEFQTFIEKNKILDMFFEESIHDEIIKRSFNLFKYFAKYDSLNNDIIEKIIIRQNNNELMRKLLIEIISELPQQKKDILYKRLSEGIKLDNINNIEFILKLTECCFNKYISIEKTPKDKNYFGLNMIFGYIIKDFDEKKIDKNNVDKTIDLCEHTISKIIHHEGFEIEDIFYFIDKLFDNIKNNNKHNSIIQSIKLIQKLMNIVRNKKYINDFIQYLKKLNETYDIITLLENDLKRYMELIPSDYINEKCRDKIYEGIYPHNINIEQRLKIIFYFFKKNADNYQFNIKGKKYIEKIYEIFKPEKYKEEQKKFFDIFSRNINEIEDIILEEFYKDILQNKKEFNLQKINDNESIDLIIEIFKKINKNNEALFDDGRNIRIDGSAPIEGFDILFDLLTQNSDKNVQNKISQLLCDVCLSFKDYNNPKIPEYWKMYFNKIILYLDRISKSHDKIAFNGIIKLLNKIYTSSINCQGKIPGKEDFKATQEPFKFYHFIKIGTKKEYRLKVGNNDRIIDIRWKVGYYFDIPVNNIAFIDLNDKAYTINDDFELFQNIFSNERYFAFKGFAYVKLDEKPFQLLEMKGNPKSLIEENENIYNILIDNLKIDLKNDDELENENKQKIWNIISKLPKNYFFINKLKKFGNKEPINQNDLLEIFDNKEIYLITYSLQCYYYFLFDKKNSKDKQINQIIPDKKEFLNNFILIHHGDKLILDKLLNIYINKDNCKPIQIECLTIIIDVLNEIEKYKENEKEIKFENIFENKDLYNNTFKKISEIISNLLELNYSNYSNYINQINDDSMEHNSKSNEINKKEINKNIADLIEHIFNFTNEISINKLSYIEFLFNYTELFIKIFIYDYIKCESDESRKKIDDFLTKNYEKKK